MSTDNVNFVCNLIVDKTLVKNLSDVLKPKNPIHLIPYLKKLYKMSMQVDYSQTFPKRSKNIK